MKLASVVIPSLLVLGLAGGASAQEHDPAEYSRIFGFVGGGASFPLSNTADNFDIGYGFNGGVGVNLNRWVGFHLEGFWSNYDAKSNLFGATNLDGHQRMQYGALDVVVNPVRTRLFGLYVLGGTGIYYRQATVTQVEGTAVVPVCNPFLFYCAPQATTVSSVVGSRSSTDFGLNAGLGVTFRLAKFVKLYAEGRYHYIFGPEFQNGAQTQRANGQYIPVMFGFRYE